MEDGRSQRRSYQTRSTIDAAAAAENLRLRRMLKAGQSRHIDENSKEGDHEDYGDDEDYHHRCYYGNFYQYEQ